MNERTKAFVATVKSKAVKYNIGFGSARSWHKSHNVHDHSATRGKRRIWFEGRCTLHGIFKTSGKHGSLTRFERFYKGCPVCYSFKRKGL